MKLFRMVYIRSVRGMHLNILPAPVRRFLLFNFMNVVSWKAFIGPVLILHANAIGIDTGKIGILNSTLYFACILGIFTKGIAERIGSKRLLLGGWTLRNILVSPIVFIPLVLQYFGLGWATLLLFVTITLFCVTRALSVIAWSTWLHEIVPPKHLGRYFTVEAIIIRFLTVAAGVACFFAFGRNNWDPANGPNLVELWKFAAFSAIGILFGLMSTRVLKDVPGGAPDPVANEAERRERAKADSYSSVLHDGMFMSFLICSGVFLSIFSATTLLTTLILKNLFHYGTGTVLFLTSAGNILAIFTATKWRLFADRHGSPATMMLTGVLSFLCLAVIGLVAYFNPQHHAALVFTLLTIACVILPVGESASTMAASRGFMLRMKTENRHACNAIWNAGSQSFCGVSSIVIGYLLKSEAGSDVLHIKYAVASIGIAIISLIAAVIVLRLKVPKGDALPGPSPIYDPAHPLLSMWRAVPYVLSPKSSSEIK